MALLLVAACTGNTDTKDSIGKVTRKRVMTFGITF